MNNSSGDSVGGFFVSSLTVAFIVLKLTGHITWSWWWVLSPLWMSLAIALGCMTYVLKSRRDL